jgi:hypothetical protein
VHVVDQVPEAVGIAVPCRRGEVARDLVAPRRHVGVLGGREQLDVGEAQVGDVVRQPLGQVAVAVAAAVGMAHPRAQVDLVHGHALVPRPGLHPAGHPLAVAPVVGRTEDHAGGGGRHLAGGGERVGLEPGHAVGPHHLELVALAGRRLRHEDLPHARPTQVAHGVDPAVPAVPIAHHPHGPGRGRPHCERRPLGALVVAGVGAERRPQPVVAPLAHQVQVEVAERRPERPWVDRRVLAAPVPAERHRVARLGLGVEQHLEHAGVVDPAHGTPVQRGGGRPRPPRAHHHLPALGVDAQHPVRVAAGPRGQLVESCRVATRRHQEAGARARRTAAAGMPTQSGRCASS